MRILLSNDDGYFAPGIAILAETLSGLASITVVAPERDRSGASNSLTLDRPLSVRKSANGFQFVNGTPTDCVHLAVTGLLEEMPDIALEVVFTHGGLDKLNVYVGLGVPEVWFYEDGAFRLYALDAQQYRLVERSQFIPDLDFDVLARFVAMDDQHEGAKAYRDELRGSKR